jgi:hypothetical protein
MATTRILVPNSFVCRCSVPCLALRLVLLCRILFCLPPDPSPLTTPQQLEQQTPTTQRLQHRTHTTEGLVLVLGLHVVGFVLVFVLVSFLVSFLVLVLVLVLFLFLVPDSFVYPCSVSCLGLGLVLLCRILSCLPPDLSEV